MCIVMTYYDQIAPGYTELHGEEQLRKAKLILKELEIKQEDKLLDIGCGTAHYLELFPCQKTGIDSSAELLKQAKVDTIQGVAENLPFPGNSFDIVLSLTAIHNFSDVQKALSEIKRVAKRDIVISVLKKASNFKDIESNISSGFEVYKKVDDIHDTIFLAKALNK